DGERHERIRKEDRVAKRQNRQLGWNRERPIAVRDVLGFEGVNVFSHERDPKSSCDPQSAIRDGDAGGGGMGSATGGATELSGVAGSYISMKSDEAPRRAACCRARCSAFSRASSQS